MLAISEYMSAKALGDSAVRNAVKNGKDPYLPVLDDIDEIKESPGEVHLGLMELPLCRICGNKEKSRSNAFANNFMPILGSHTEFGLKWTALYESFVKEGIRDAIKCYEYMGRYYVQEGNKRVSVSKYGGSDFILADVIRVLPPKNDSRENKAYYEYLDFYDVTKDPYIVLNVPGEYARLAALMGEDLEHPWPDEKRSDLKAAFFRFCSVTGAEEDALIGEAFLVYAGIYTVGSLLTDSTDTVTSKIMRVREEMIAALSSERTAFFDDVPEAAKKGGWYTTDLSDMYKRSNLARMIGRGEGHKIMTTALSELFSDGSRVYTADKPLKAAFIYDKDIESSRWINSHEAGRLYLSAVVDNVRARAYIKDSSEDVSATINRAVADGCELVFTVRGSMIGETLQAALEHPNVHFFNCSVGNTYASVGCYQGKLYEASFLIGILAADIVLREGGVREIGYISSERAKTSVAELNAFAAGVSLIDPDMRIMLGYRQQGDALAGFRERGIGIYADMEYLFSGTGKRAGLFRAGGDGDAPRFIGAPYYNWGQFYVRLVQSLITGTYSFSEILNDHRAANYWFGLSTGVVDVIVKDVPPQTRRMLSYFKSAVMNGGMDPFSGELHFADGKITGKQENARSVPVQLDKLSSSDILGMESLLDNIIEI